MQFEGETNRRGKGPNIWDTFIEEHPGISLFNAGVRYNAFLPTTTNINLSSNTYSKEIKPKLWKFAERISDHSNAKVAVDFYNRYKVRCSSYFTFSCLLSIWSPLHLLIYFTQNVIVRCAKNEGNGNGCFQILYFLV